MIAKRRKLHQKPIVSDPNASNFFQILSLSGGGYRGLFTASILEELEQRAGKPLKECFDLIAGTSIGGIIACGLAAGIPMSTIRKEFEAKGDRIFDRTVTIFGRRLFRVPKLGLFGARYGRTGLQLAIEGTLGSFATAKLINLPKPLLVPAVSATTGKAHVFDSQHAAADPGVTLKDVALATSAAPTYFPEYSVRGNSLVDGGIIANAPDVLAVVKAISFFGRQPKEIKLLSVGTSGVELGEVYQEGRASGVLGWMVSRNLFGLTVAAQQSLSLDLVHQILGANNVRIDYVAAPVAAKPYPLTRLVLPPQTR